MSFSVKIIRDTFNKTRPISSQVTQKFYDTLFKNHPDAEGLFHAVESTKQQELLYNSLDFIVTNLENPDRLSEYLQNLGGRHLDYGTEETHFDWVGGALLETFAHFFGDEWTEEVADNWGQAFGIIKDHMLIGMRTKGASNANVVAMNKNSEAQPQEAEKTSSAASEAVSNASFEIPQNVKDEIASAVKLSLIHI